MRIALPYRFYLRLWLAVVGAVAVLTLLVGWLWRMEVERERMQRPAREIVLRNAQGEVVGQALARPLRVPGPGVEFEVPTVDGQTLYIHLPRPASRPASMQALAWWQPSLGFAWLLGLVAFAVALGAYPVVRRLTKRLEALQQGVESWGAGDLSRRLPEEGSDEVAFLAQRFNIAAERVQALLVAHKTLLANASHELRTPLTRIRMGLELMGEQPSAKLRDEVARNIRELDQLIDEILLASRLDASPTDMGPLESVDLVGLCAEECAYAEAEFVMEFGRSSLPVQGVARLLRRVLRNLLENARRHASANVTLTLQSLEHQALIRICDRGPGVPAEYRQRIFEPFYRLPGASERDGGVGLGLALARSIILRHGGSISCEDRPGGGACFVLTLPSDA
jgi:signal transduction histidine kinase